MELSYLFEAGVSLLGLVVTGVFYVIGLRLRHDILANNEKIEREIGLVREKLNSSINGLRDELIKEFGTLVEKQSDKTERIDRDVNEMSAGMGDRILSVVNGKYVRSDLHQQTIIGIQERFTSMKELIEVNMDKIEQSLDRQMLDLKERIFHGK